MQKKVIPHSTYDFVIGMVEKNEEIIRLLAGNNIEEAIWGIMEAIIRENDRLASLSRRQVIHILDMDLNEPAEAVEKIRCWLFGLLMAESINIESAEDDPTEFTVLPKEAPQPQAKLAEVLNLGRNYAFVRVEGEIFYLEGGLPGAASFSDGIWVLPQEVNVTLPSKIHLPPLSEKSRLRPDQLVKRAIFAGYIATKEVEEISRTEFSREF